MTSSTCCFLTCIQVSLEAGKVVWYSHLLFPLLWMNMSSHCPLASMVSKGKSAVNLVEDRSYMISIFFLAAFKIFSLSLACSSLIIICTGVNPLSFSLEFLGGVKCSFYQIWKKMPAIVSSTTISILSPLSIWDSQDSYLGTFHGVSQLSETVYFPSFSFSFLFLQLTIPVDLLSGLLILSSTCSDLPVSPSNVLISIIFDSRISIWFFF